MPNRINLTNVFGTKSITLDQYPPEAWDWLAGDPDGADSADVKTLSDAVPWLYRGLNILVQAVASVPVCMVKGKKDVGYLGDPDINTPFPYMEDLPALLRHISASVILEGYGYLFRDNARSIQATKKLWYWNPLSVKFDDRATKDSKILTFRRRVDGQDTQYTSKEVIYFWPEDVYVEVGPPHSSPAKAALCASGVLYNIDQYVAAYFKRGAVKAMMLAVKGNPPQDEKNKFLKWWREQTGGIKKAFNTFILNAESVTPTVVGDGLEGLQDTELTKEKREDISTALGIPQSILFSSQAGGLGGAGVMSEDTFRFYNMTVVPLAHFLADTLNKQQFADTGYQLQVREEEMDVFQEDENARATAVSTTVNALADPEKYLIAAAIQGVEIPKEIEAMIRELIAKQEEEKKQMQEQLANQPSGDRRFAQDATAKGWVTINGNHVLIGEDENQLVNKEKEIYKVSNANGLLNKYSTLAVGVSRGDDGKIYASPKNLSHNEMIASADQDASIDNFVRFTKSYRGGERLLEANIDSAGVVYYSGMSNEDYETEAVNNVYKATSKLVRLGLEASTKVEINVNGKWITTTAKSIIFTLERGVPNKAMLEDLARLRRKAYKNIGKLFTFQSDCIPELDALLVKLNSCKCEEEMKAVFEAVNTTAMPAPVYSTPDYTPILEAMRMEVEAIKLTPVPQPPPSYTFNIAQPDAPVVNVTPEIKADMQMPTIQVNVPEQPAPVVNITNEVNVPEQPAPVVEVSPVIKIPARQNRKVTVNRDSSGNITGLEEK